MRYEVKVYEKYTGYDKTWLEVEANSEEEAKEKILEGHYDYIDSKNINVEDRELIEDNEWVFRKLKER